jgi:hypothetical protein
MIFMVGCNMFSSSGGGSSPPAPPPVNNQPIQYVVWDGNLIPSQMRAAGFDSTDLALDFALFSSYGSHIWGYVGDDPKNIYLNEHQDDIRRWFTNYVAGIIAKVKANPNATILIIANDANDRGGLYMWQNIKNQLNQAGIPDSKISIGAIY